jgi:hypothetical protein
VEPDDGISPATWMALGVVRRMRRQTGRWPAVDTCTRVAQEEGADPYAVIVLALHQLPYQGQDLDGACVWYKTLLTPGRVQAPTAEAVAAVQLVRERFPGTVRAECIAPKSVIEEPTPPAPPPLGDPRVEYEFLEFDTP